MPVKIRSSYVLAVLIYLFKDVCKLYQLGDICTVLSIGLAVQGFDSDDFQIKTQVPFTFVYEALN
ncbi:hypothetical protein [Pseudoalteromonas byunsanensis]|uniref:Uncharacterized protein n=1 Tax=Pseudoalteromonas byunsanensis TaxID=327939 RepID=A0A1S1NAY0_9GAMM|nr:hypothetical protein [Pseudoalteromonas byunsanensis]OHU97239.1 hypothetical protein BIW53_02675 [Pseudoalteromonas byunsanensis]